jgi:hypothetical protein
MLVLFSFSFAPAFAVNKGTANFGVEVNLLTTDKYGTGIVYTPYCLSECHLPLEIKYSGIIAPASLSFSSKNISSSISKLNPKDDITTGMLYLTNKTDSYTENKCSDSCNTLGNGTKNCSSICTPTTKYAWKYVWSNTPPSSLSKNNILVVDIVGKRKASTAGKADVIPTVFNFQLPEFAWFNSTWTKKKLIEITNNDPGTLKKYHTINVTMDTSSIVCDGMRVVYNDITELNMTVHNATLDFIDANMGTYCGRTNTTIYFMLQADIAPGATNNTHYYIYYGNTTPVDKYPNSMDNVFILYDDFNRADGAIGNGWLGIQAGTQITSGQLDPSGNNAGAYKNFTIGGLTDLSAWDFYISSIHGDGTIDGSNWYMIKNNTGGAVTFNEMWANSRYHVVDYFEDSGAWLEFASAGTTQWIGANIKKNNPYYKTAGTITHTRTIHYDTDGDFDLWVNNTDSFAKTKLVWNITDNADASSTAGYGIILFWNRGLAGADNVMFRRYINTSPTVALGTEESSAGNTAPRWSNNQTTFTSPQSYSSSRNYGFEIRWTDDSDANGYNYSYISHNFTGSSANYGTTGAGNISYYNFTGIPSGFYSFSFTANDSSNAVNTSSTWYFTIDKAVTYLNETINGTQGDKTVTFPNVTNVTAWNNQTGSTGVTLLRNGTDIGASYDISKLGAGYWNYTATYSHANFTADPVMYYVTVNQFPSGISLTATPGWIVTPNTQVTISCSAVIPTTLYKDGNVITSPYVATLPFANYNFSCVVSDTMNYSTPSAQDTLVVTSAGFGCTNTDTFAFRKTISSLIGDYVNLDFSDLVAGNLTKSDLSDVYVNTTGTNAYKNGTKLVVNITGHSSIDVLFGNYVIYHNYTAHSLSDNTTNMTGYTELNPYYVLTFYNEKTGTYLLPPTANNSITLFCSGGSTEFSLNHTKILVSTFLQLTDIKATVRYSSTEMYYRNLQTSGFAQYKNFYMVDANVYQVVENLITLQDVTGTFKGATLKIKKWLESSEQTITEVPFDAQSKAIIFLINGDKYQIYVDNGVEERAIGYIYSDATDLTKTIIIGGLALTNYTYGNVSYTWNLSNGVISFTWNDQGNNTNLVEFWVYNYTNQSQLFYSASSTNRSRVNFNYIVPDENASYWVKFKAYHSIFGNETTEAMTVFTGSWVYPTVFPLLLLITSLGGSSTVWLSFLVIIPFGMIFTEKYVDVGIFAVISLGALMVYWKMYAIGGSVIAICLVLGVLVHLKKRGGEEG